MNHLQILLKQVPNEMWYLVDGYVALDQKWSKQTGAILWMFVPP